MISLNYIQSTLLEIPALITRISISQNVHLNQLSQSKLLLIFHSSATIDEYITWLCNILDEYKRNFALRNESIDIEFLEKIVAYIIENLDNQISLNLVAEEFHISSGRI